MSKERKQSTEAAVREIRRRTRRKFSPDPGLTSHLYQHFERIAGLFVLVYVVSGGVRSRGCGPRCSSSC